MSEDELKQVLASPFYCLERIHPVFAETHEPLVSEEQWIAANVQSIKELGAEEWLKTLLAVLKSGGPTA